MTTGRRMQKFDSSFGVVIYKKKILLLLRDNDPDIASPNSWSFIGGIPDKGETAEQTYIREVKEATNITIKKPTLIMEYILDGKKKYVYSNVLSDHDVNTMKLGDEGQSLGFFTMHDMHKIQLSKNPAAFLKDHGDILLELTR